MNYGDNSYSRGNVAVDTLTLGSTDNRPVQVKNIIIGCGHENAVTFRNKSSGIVGLGGGAISLIKQLGDSIEGKFSYCLVPENDQTSKISFGTNAVVSGPGTVSTPLVVKSPETFYFITLKSITVGSKNMPTPGSDIKGNMVIDSGTTLTLLPGKYYFQIESAVASLIDAERSKDERIGSSLCYNATADLKFPVITMHFDGADVKLDSYNSFF
ncbi:Aspartic peptidase domain superfamily [Arabidopsis suecica]|uniref:Aspartic peptidase domain superfamily n=1 Tax=Arabidopsis suecica TaxID=45249 RepID=A0A8T1XIJ7_ARASU|nr:Aspartic peptidase domain superfamily [Arabidopsis suecica]